MRFSEVLSKHVGPVGGVFSGTVGLLTMGASYVIRGKKSEDAAITNVVLSTLTGLLAGTTATSLCMTVSHIVAGEGDKASGLGVVSIVCLLATGVVALLPRSKPLLIPKDDS